jgi:hypothetical protein
MGKGIENQGRCDGIGQRLLAHGLEARAVVAEILKHAVPLDRREFQSYQDFGLGNRLRSNVRQHFPAHETQGSKNSCQKEQKEVVLVYHLLIEVYLWITKVGEF